MTIGELYDDIGPGGTRYIRAHGQTWKVTRAPEDPLDTPAAQADDDLRAEQAAEAREYE